MGNYKKPGFWIGLLAAAAAVFVAVCLVTAPAEETPVPPPEPVETALPVNTVTVKNPEELLAAIASNTEIILEPGSYILSEAADYGGEGTEHYKWQEVYDGWQLTLTGVENMTLRGSGKHVTVVETDPRYANVLAMEHCDGVVLEDITFGHIRDRGECSGGVIDLLACRNVTMNGLGLFGCGVMGLRTESCSDITLTDSDVYECSSSAGYLYNSSDVRITGNRIYDIGDGEYGGYTFFDIEGCPDVLIENNSFSDSDLYNLISTGGSQVALKNNLFSGNRPKSAVFSGYEVNITMDGNRFEDNSVRNWYDDQPTAKDKAGNLLTEEKLREMYGTAPVPAEPKRPQLEVHVSTVDELIAAIGPDRDIVLEGMHYDLSTATGYGTSENEYYFWEDIFDGPGLVIRNVSNMTIRSNDGKFTEHIIETVPRYADVLQFRACDNITLSGFTAGHTKEPGSCTGGVLEFYDSDSITVDNCGLFGCGILGVQAENCGNVIVQNSSIYECSQGGVEMRNVEGIVIEGTSFRDIGGRTVIRLSNCKKAMVNGQQLLENGFGSYEESTEEQEKTFALQAAVNDFANSYLYDDREYMQIYLAEGYAPEPWVSEHECSSLLWVEVTYEHVQELQKNGSMIFEVPFREWDGEYVDETMTRCMMVTVIEEDGIFKVSNCQVK